MFCVYGVGDKVPGDSWPLLSLSPLLKTSSCSTRSFSISSWILAISLSSCSCDISFGASASASALLTGLAAFPLVSRRVWALGFRVRVFVRNMGECVCVCMCAVRQQVPQQIHGIENCASLPGFMLGAASPPRMYMYVGSLASEAKRQSHTAQAHSNAMLQGRHCAHARGAGGGMRTNCTEHQRRNCEQAA